MTPESETVDVLICGSGSAGLCAAVWLARFGIPYKILERRDGPLKIGQADGVQTRTVEIFDSFGIAEDLLKEAYHVLEVAFWAPDDKGIRRTRYAPDKETEISHQPHVILNQARLNALMMSQLGVKPPVEYETEVKGVEVDEIEAKNPDAYAVKVTAVKDGVEKRYKAKYVLVGHLRFPLFLDKGCDADDDRAATAPTASSGNPSASKWLATAPTPSGASWTSTRRPTSRTSAKSVSSTRPPAAS